MKTKKTIVYGLLIVWLFMLVAAMGGCTPEQKARSSQRKLNRLLKKHPELIGTDTIMKDTVVTVPGIVDSVSFSVGTDTAVVDRLTAHFALKVDSVTLDSLNTGFKTILKKATTFDTVITSGHARYHVKEKEGRFNIELETPPVKKKISVPVAINKISAKYVPKWYERFFMWIGKEALIVTGGFMFILFLVAAYKFVRKFVL